MKATYRSKPFEAFQLAPDMSNWKEALEFMGQTPSKEREGSKPEFLDVETGETLSFAYPTDWIAKNSDGDLHVFTDDELAKWYDRL